MFYEEDDFIMIDMPPSIKKHVIEEHVIDIEHEHVIDIKQEQEQEQEQEPAIEIKRIEPAGSVLFVPEVSVLSPSDEMEHELRQMFFHIRRCFELCYRY